MVAFIKEVQAEIGKPKFTFESMEIDHDLFEAIKDEFIEDVRAAMDTDDKNIRDERMLPIYDRLHAEYDEKYPEQGAMLDECIYKLQKYVVRRWLLDDGKRVDGRGMDEIRPLDAEVGIIPRVHGSGMFTRGQTQVLTIATLAPFARRSSLMGLMSRPQSVISTSTICPPTLSARPAPAAAPVVVRSVTAHWQSAHWSLSFPALRNSLTRCVWFPRFFPPTDPPLRAPSAALRWRSWTPVFPSRRLLPVSPADLSPRATAG